MDEPKTRTITLRRHDDRIYFISASGARVAYLRDGEDHIVYDPLADTEEMLGDVNYRDVIRELGLDDVRTVRRIARGDA